MPALANSLDLTVIQYLLSIVSGVIVGFSLGIIGGGGSILAIPLFIYLVGINDPHLAIVTTALAVGLNSFVNLFFHLRKKNVDIKIGVIFSIVGFFGVMIGSTLGLITPGGSLLLFFSFLMVVIGIYMLLGKREKVRKEESGEKNPRSWKSIIYSGLAGFGSGYFGIGGGFLLVPAILFSNKITINKAVGTSLMAVGTFGITTAIRYSLSGFVLLPVSLLFLMGGFIGGFTGSRISTGIDRRTLTKIFSIIVVAVGVYIMLKSLP